MKKTITISLFTIFSIVGVNAQSILVNSVTINGYKVNGVSNDTTISTQSTSKVMTESAVKQLINNRVVSVPVIASGIFSPTITNTYNITSSSLVEATYTIIGKIVQVFLKVNIMPTSALSNTQLNFTLPFNSVSSSGIGYGSVTQVGLGYVLPASSYWVTTNIAQLYFQNPNNTSSCVLSITYTYQTP